MSDTNRRHPESNFSTEYPYNQATITRSGHEFHVNDAPGNESLKVSHTTGTYVEIEKTGRWVQTVVEKVYQYFKNTFSLTVDSHADIKVGGTYNFNVDKSSYEAYGLDRTVGVGDDLIDGVGGVRQLHTEKDKLESINGMSVSSVKGDVNSNIDGSSVTTIGGTKVDILGNDWSVTGKNIEMTIDGDFRIKCKNFIVDAQTITMTTSAGDVTITSAGRVSINGSPIDLTSSTINISGSQTNINGSPVKINNIIQTGS